MLKGRVLKKQADLFDVELNGGQVVSCVARKNMKKDGVFVGDVVVLDEDKTIASVEKRKNILIRPPMANIDRMFIVLAPVPKPDLYTIDKLIIFCTLNSIEPILCVNKSDLSQEECKNLARIYEGIVKTNIFSSQDESVQSLKKQIEGICVLAGQSAVGKSSIINALKQEAVAKVDTFSKKIERGKQTTRTVQLYKFGKNKYLADTAGFSKLDEGLLDLEEDEVWRYFPEFVKPAGECKYKSCQHISSKDCGVCKALKEGKIQKTRYENYLKLREIIKGIKRF